ncbi:urocortin [Ornithorhynchus anatinus]|uniref:Urocortin n=1 Tax=Ornithorhynchus anatinus TaxID=9258 RepID=A0A6I8P2M9_ORNAN|nr:urocortin [Ornithorhynchus anatinus]
MRRLWRPALWTALLLLAQLRPGSGRGAPAAARGAPARSPGGPAGSRPGGARALLLLLLLLPPERAPAGPEAGGRPELGAERPKREEPPLSIDLTFHLLRTLLELARTQSQRERAEQNRLIFDSVGK